MPAPSIAGDRRRRDQKRPASLEPFSSRNVCLPNMPGETARLRRRWLVRRLPPSDPCRACSLFTMSNIRAIPKGPHEPRYSPDDERPPGGARRDRTDDLMLAKHALSQLSYGPLGRTPRNRMVGLGRLERPTSPLSGVRSNHLSYRPEDPRIAGSAAERDTPITHCPEKKEKRRRRRSRQKGLTGPCCSKRSDMPARNGPT
jgi:hypothetical protein